MVLYPLGDPFRIFDKGGVASALEQEIPMDYEAIVVEHYRAAIEKYGRQAIYSKSRLGRLLSGGDNLRYDAF